MPLSDLIVPDGWTILEIGSGPNHVFGRSTTLDIRPEGAPDILHDLNITPYPLPDNSFDLVVCLHVLEHVRELVAATTEIHRVLKPGGLLYVEAPYFSSVHSFTDPTHVHAFTSRSFDYYVEESLLSKFGYSPARFEKVKVEIVVPGDGVLNRWVRGWINSHHRFYEERLAFLFPRHTIRYVLRVVK